MLIDQGMKKLFAIAILLIQLSATLPAQTTVDSLWHVWNNTALEDTVRLNALHRVVLRRMNSNPDSARMLAGIELAFAREKELTRWQARALNNLGLTYRLQSDYANAIDSYEQSIALSEKSGDKNLMSAIYGNLGDVYRLQSNFPKAIDCISKCRALAEETGDRKKVADAYVSIATIYYEVPDNDAKTLEYLDKALEIYKSLDNQMGLSLVYGNMAAVYLDRNELDKALDFNDRSMAIQQKLGDERGIATSLHNRAVIRSSQGRYQEALADFNREIRIFEKIGDQDGLADAYNSMGDLWIQQGRYPLAIDVCRKALQMAQTLGESNLRAMQACNCLYMAYRKQGNYRLAFDYLDRYTTIRDSLQKDETDEKLRQMERRRQTAVDSLQHEKEKFQMEITHQQALRKKDRTLGWLAAGGLGGLAIALAFWVRMLYFRRRSQQLQLRAEAWARQELLYEVALLRSQVNPHFLFNSLSILSSLVHVDANLSEQFIEQLSRSYRYILEQKEQSLVTLRTEMEFLRSYSFLLKIRFENKFDLVTALSEEILDNCKIAPLTLQLLLENAVKHNRMSAKEPLVVTINVENGDTLVVRNPLQPRAATETSTGIGLQNIISRYALLTDRPVWAGETEGQFVVRVPLL